MDRFEQQYENYVAGNLIPGVNIMDQIHKRVQIFLHSYNTTSLDESKSIAL